MCPSPLLSHRWPGLLILPTTSTSTFPYLPAFFVRDGRVASNFVCSHAAPHNPLIHTPVRKHPVRSHTQTWFVSPYLFPSFASKAHLDLNTSWHSKGNMFRPRKTLTWSPDRLLCCCALTNFCASFTRLFKLNYFLRSLNLQSLLSLHRLKLNFFDLDIFLKNSTQLFLIHFFPIWLHIAIWCPSLKHVWIFHYS